MNKLAPEDIELKFVSSLACKSEHISQFIDKKFGIEMEKVSKVISDGHFAKPKTYFFITGQEKEYTDLEELCKDWNEIKNFDDPNNEIEWVKVIKGKSSLITVSSPEQDHAHPSQP